MPVPPCIPTAPRYILRGHKEPVHTVQLFSNNLRLVSGDADGWVIVWDMTLKRPHVVWKAHEGALLEVKAYQIDTVVEIYT